VVSSVKILSEYNLEPVKVNWFLQLFRPRLVLDKFRKVLDVQIKVLREENEQELAKKTMGST
jgi:hypothetical protein